MIILPRQARDKHNRVSKAFQKSICGALRCEGTSSCRSRWRRCTRRPSHARRAAAAVACPPCRCSSTSPSTVLRTSFVAMPFYATNRIFAKTGSGKTQEKLNEGRFCLQARPCISSSRGGSPLAIFCLLLLLLFLLLLLLLAVSLRQLVAGRPEPVLANDNLFWPRDKRTATHCF